MSIGEENLHNSANYHGEREEPASTEHSESKLVIENLFSLFDRWASIPNHAASQGLRVAGYSFFRRRVLKLGAMKAFRL